MSQQELDCDILQENCRRIVDNYRDCINCYIWHRVKRHGEDPKIFKNP